MPWHRTLLRQLRVETEPDSNALDRMYLELCGIGEHPETALLLNGLPMVTPHAASRVAERLGNPGRRTRWTRSVLAVATVLAAAVLLALRATPPERMEMPLQATQQHQSNPISGVQLTYQGTGHLNGMTRDLMVDWELGTLQVDVEPKSDTTLVVATPDGTVRAIGTTFTVVRDPLGTHVAVENGLVEIACTNGADSVLMAGESHTCLPASAAGMLGRAVTLRQEGAGPQMVLDAADAGLATAKANSALIGELQQIRLRALLELNRPAQALSTAEQYLSDLNAPRRMPVLRIASGLANQLDGCTAAIPYLEELVALQPNERDQKRLQRCRARVFPGVSP